MNTLDVQALECLFAFWSTIAFLKMLYRNSHSHAAKLTSLAKCLLLFYECATVNVAKLDDRMLGLDYQIRYG